jgi:hypothetical protein
MQIIDFYKEYTMTTDTRTPAERAYDAERDGSIYVKPDAEQRAAAIMSYLETLPPAERNAVWDRAEEIMLAKHFGDAPADIPISADEQAIVTWIMQQTACGSENTDGIIAVLEDGERRRIDERFDRCIDAVAELPDSQRAQAISLWEGFLAGCAAGVLVDWDRLKEMPIDTAVDTFGAEAIIAATKAHRQERAPHGGA